MIRKLLATTAIATLVATGAFAQTTTTDTTTGAAAAQPAPAPTELAPAITADGSLASNIIGTRVYNGDGDDAANVGEVNDIVLGKDGKVQALVIGVGGFLGIGEKDVAVDYSKVKWTDKDGKRWLVIPNSKDELKSQTAFDRSAYKPMSTVASNTAAPADTNAMAPATDAPATDAPATDTPAADTNTMAPATGAATDSNAMAPATTEDKTAMAPAAADATQTGAIDRSTLKPADMGTFRTEDFVGTTVYGANDARVGEVGDVAMTQDGKVDSVVLDVGGFLGIGEKEVAVALENLQFMADGKGNRYLYTTFTKDQLEAQPAYDKGTYADNRDKQRMMMTK